MSTKQIHPIVRRLQQNMKKIKKDSDRYNGKIFRHSHAYWGVWYKTYKMLLFEKIELKKKGEYN